MMDSQPIRTPEANKWQVMIAVAMGIFLATIDGSIVNVALPTLVKALDTEFAVVQWVVLAYLLTVTTLLLGIGRLADMFGKKPIYFSGLVVFLFGSALCGLAPSVYALIAFRVVQAIGAAMIMALGMAIITEAFPPAERGKALGISGTFVSLGIITGPTIGGFILQAATWNWIFFVNLPIGVLGLYFVLRFVPNTRPVGGEKFDFLGALALFITLITFLLSLTAGQKVGFDHAGVLSGLAGTLIFLGMFIRIESRSDHPVIDLSLFRRLLFSINLITGFLTFVSNSGIGFLMPFYLENVRGYSPQQVGLLMAIVPILVGITAPVAGSLSDRFGTRPLAVVGLGMLLFGYILVSTLSTDTTSLGYILRFAPVGLGLGLFQSPNNSAIMGAVPRTRLGIANGLLAITRTLGQTTGISILGAIWATRSAALAGEVANGITSAPAWIQVTALNQTSRVIVGLLVIALSLSIWALVVHRREQHQLREGILA